MTTDTDTIDRDIPGEQRPDGELDSHDADLIAVERAQELSEKFDAIAVRTVREGVVKGLVTGIYVGDRNGKVSIEVDVPAESEDERFFLDRPKSWDRRYQFVRWVEGHGYGPSDFAGMIQKGVEVDVQYDNGDYDLVIPDIPRSRRVQARDLLRDAVHQVLETVVPGTTRGAKIGLGLTALVGGTGTLAVIFASWGAGLGDAIILAAFASFLMVGGIASAMVFLGIVIIVLQGP